MDTMNIVQVFISEIIFQLHSLEEFPVLKPYSYLLSFVSQYQKKRLPMKSSFFFSWMEKNTKLSSPSMNFFLPRNSKKIDYVHRVDMLKMIRSATCPDQMKGDLFRTRQIKRKSPGQYA